MAVRRTGGWFAALMNMFGRNWITLFGASVTTASVIAIAAFVLLAAFDVIDSLYAGIVAFLVLPGIFVGGLLLIPIGAYWEHRRRKRAEQHPHYLTLDFSQPLVRRSTAIIGGLTLVNLLLISSVSYRGVVYMEGPEFCGKVCHSVMQPEYTSYINSPHARVECVKCHIGPGAPWFVRSKLSGVGQVLAVTFKTYEHPIPTPVANLRPSQDTCEQCHWPARFTGDRMRIITKYADDEKNTETKTVLLMHIGGGATGGPGIHSWHIDPKKETTYYTDDPKRLHIAGVRVKEADGAVAEYAEAGPDSKPVSLAGMEGRRMDCIDCHSRPTHIFQMPGKAMDLALAEGRINKNLPFIKKIGMETLRAATGNPDDLTQIADKVRAFYKENHADAYATYERDIDAAIEVMQGIYNRNIFPNMDVTWGTYRTHIGHNDEEFAEPEATAEGHASVYGCFRCHDESHSTADGKTIRQDCTICHTVLAMDEENPAVLEQLGMSGAPAAAPAPEEAAAATESTPAPAEPPSAPAEPATPEPAPTEK